MTSILNDDTLILRALEPTDLDALYRWENDTALWAVGNSIAPFSRKSLWDYIESYTPDIYSCRQLRLMIALKDDNTPVGTIDFYDFDHHNRRAGIGILIAEEHQKKGYGERALKLAASYAGQHVGLHQLWAVIPVDNTPSIALFRECGYKICGRLRSWLRRGKSYADAFSLQYLIS